MTAACCIALAIVWAMVGAGIQYLRQVERIAAGRELRATATLLADHNDRTFQGVDLLLSLLAQRIETAMAEAAVEPAESLHAMLRAGLAGLPQVRRAMVFEAEGNAVADSESLVPRQIAVAALPHFNVHRAHADAGLHISDPLRSRLNGRWSILLTRRLNTRSGAFAGVIVAVLDPSYLVTLFRSAGMSTGTRISLIKRSGRMLSTTLPHMDGLLEAGMAATSLDFSRPDLPRAGAMPTRSAVTGTERVGAYALGSSYPLVIVAARELADVDVAQRGRVALIVAVGAALSLSIMLAAWTVTRRVRSLEDRFRDGIEHMSDGFILWDAEERLVAWNSCVDAIMPAMAPFRAPGIRFADYIRTGGAVVFAALPPAEAEAAVAERIVRFRAPGAPWEFTTVDGAILEVEETRTRSGGTVSVYRDVTARRRQQQDVEKALVAEREANLMHRRFIAMASHEFRTPLAVIDGAAQRVLGGAAAELDRGRLADRMMRIREAVARMTQLIDRMLSSARLDEGRIELSAERFDLSALLLEVVGRQRQISTGFDIVLRLPDQPILMHGDPQLLDQVFTNLLSNAVKYSGRSRRVEVAAACGEAGERPIEVTVTDHGIGVPEDEIASLFTRFYRASTAAGISGTGIGLHLSRELVHLHGGAISVRSQPGSGTTFTVRLPSRCDARSCDARNAA